MKKGVTLGALRVHETIVLVDERGAAFLAIKSDIDTLFALN